MPAALVNRCVTTCCHSDWLEITAAFAKNHQHVPPRLLEATSEHWLSAADGGAEFHLANRSWLSELSRLVWWRPSLQPVNCTFADTKGLGAACLAHKRNHVPGALKMQDRHPFQCHRTGCDLPADSEPKVSA